jgi:hypothetical protein
VYLKKNNDKDRLLAYFVCSSGLQEHLCESEFTVFGSVDLL